MSEANAKGRILEQDPRSEVLNFTQEARIQTTSLGARKTPDGDLEKVYPPKGRGKKVFKYVYSQKQKKDRDNPLKTVIEEEVRSQFGLLLKYNCHRTLSQEGANIGEDKVNDVLSNMLRQNQQLHTGENLEAELTDESGHWMFQAEGTKIGPRWQDRETLILNGKEVSKLTGTGILV